MSSGVQTTSPNSTPTLPTLNSKSLAWSQTSATIESAQRTIENSPAIDCWVRDAKLRCEPVKRATEDFVNARFVFSHPFHGLRNHDLPYPTDESVGYCHPSAARTKLFRDSQKEVSMSNSGKQLEMLVQEIERHLLPQAFEVELNKREFNGAGEQIAEFDIVITGRVGSGVIKWLVECRDRPSQGSAPNSWIEQLATRKRRFNFDKVIAVSATGFAKGAQELAMTEGVLLRTVKKFDEIGSDFNVKEANYYAQEVIVGPVDLAKTHPEIHETKSLTSGKLKLVQEAEFLDFPNFVVRHASVDLFELMGSASFRFELYCEMVDALINEKRIRLSSLTLPIQLDIHVYEAKALEMNLYSDEEQMIGRDTTFCFELPTGCFNFRVLFLNNFDGTQNIRFFPPENVPNGFTVDSLNVFVADFAKTNALQ